MSSRVCKECSAAPSRMCDVTTIENHSAPKVEFLYWNTGGTVAFMRWVELRDSTSCVLGRTVVLLELLLEADRIAANLFDQVGVRRRQGQDLF